MGSCYSAGDVEEVEEPECTCLTRAGFDPTITVDARNGKGRTRLHAAVECQCMHCLVTVLDRGADLEAKLDDNFWYKGDTALHLACIHKCPRILHALLNRFSDIQAKNNEGNSPLHTASLYHNAEAIRVLLANSAEIQAKNNYL